MSEPTPTDSPRETTDTARDPEMGPGHDIVSGGHVDLTMHVGPLYFDAHRVVYATIILMTTYALYDEGTDPFGPGPLIELFGLSLAPLFALAMAHAFSDAIDLQIRNGRRLNRHDRLHLMTTNLQYLYVAIPPMALIVLLSLFQWHANDIVSFVQVVGIGSLAFWGAYAARRAGLGRWLQVRFAFGYAIMGLIIITVELILTH